MKGRGAPAEAQGKVGFSKSTKAPGVTILQAVDGCGTEELSGRTKSDHNSDTLVENAVSKVVARMHGIAAEPPDQIPLGPILTSEVHLEGPATPVLLDISSPVSTISLDFFLQAASAGKTGNQSPEDCGRDVRKRFIPVTTVVV